MALFLGIVCVTDLSQDVLAGACPSTGTGGRRETCHPSQSKHCSTRQWAQRACFGVGRVIDHHSILGTSDKAPTCTPILTWDTSCIATHPCMPGIGHVEHFAKSILRSLLGGSEH